MGCYRRLWTSIVNKKPNLLLALTIAVFVVVVVIEIAYGDDHKRHDDDITIAIAGGENTASNIVSGSHSYGVSQSLGDVDINDCLASTQWGIPVIYAKQTVQENPWCMANSLDARGAHAAAAKVRCTTETIKAIYPDSVICERAVMFQMKHIEKPKKVDRDDENYDRLTARMTAYETERAQDQANAEKAVERANARVVRAEQAIQQQIPIDDGSTRRAMAREAYQKALNGEE